MEEKDTISELEDVSPLLLTAGKRMLFTIPSGYFETLTDITVVNCLHVAKGGLMLKSGPFTVSQAYFDKLPYNILQKVADAGELHKIAPVLSSVNRQNLYTIPAQYFVNTLEFKSIIEKSAVRGKIISFAKTRKWFNYASAAIVAGILVMGAFLFTDNHERFNKDGVIDVHNELHKLSDEELSKYLDNVKSTMNLDQVTGVSDGDIPDVEENLKAVSDEELKQYLRENDVPETKSETGS